MDNGHGQHEAARLKKRTETELSCIRTFLKFGNNYVQKKQLLSVYEAIPVPMPKAHDQNKNSHLLVF